MKNNDPPFEILDHPADVGFLARGRTLAELFANAALALMSLGWELDDVEEKQRREIEADGEDAEALLYAWLSEILAIADADRLVFRRFEVTELTESRVRGAAWGEQFDASRHRARTYVKAVTLHQFEINETEAGWTARVYVDV
jgi:SHS2 domain-containing protein